MSPQTTAVDTECLLRTPPSPPLGNITDCIEPNKISRSPQLRDVGVGFSAHRKLLNKRKLIFIQPLTIFPEPEGSPCQSPECTSSLWTGETDEAFPELELIVSPLWIGETGTEAFPPFIDVASVTDKESTHCMVHCAHPVCKRICKNEDIRCLCLKTLRKETDEDDFAPREGKENPELKVDSAVYQSLPSMFRGADADQVINLDMPEILNCVNQYLIYMIKHSERLDMMLEHLQDTSDIVMTFCNTLRKYFENKLLLLQEQQEPLTVGTVVRELHVITVMEFYDWVWETFEEESAKSLTKSKDWRFGLYDEKDGLAGLVGSFWRYGIEDVAALLVLRSQQLGIYQLQLQEAKLKRRKAAKLMWIKCTLGGFGSFVVVGLVTIAVFFW